MQRQLLYIFVSVIASIVLMLGQYFYSLTTVPGNGFTREFVSTPMGIKKTIYLKGQNYIAGASASKISLGILGTSEIMEIDLSSNPFSISYKRFDTRRFSLPKITIDSLLFFFEQLGGNRIVYGSEGTDGGVLNDNTLVIDAEPISSASTIVKTLSEDGKEFVLAKQSKGSLIRFPDLLEKQIDGKFCTDGLLRANKNRDTIVYVYYYRNEFMCLDSSLNLLFRAKTIDTTRFAKISVARISSEESFSLSSPARIVNHAVQISDELIFIHSNLMADNENPADFKTHAVIDVYHLHDGSYQYSFYIPKIKDLNVIEFKPCANKLFLLYRNVLQICDFNLPRPGL